MLVLREKRGHGRSNFWGGENGGDFFGGIGEEGGKKNGDIEETFDKTGEDLLEFFGLTVFSKLPRLLLVDGLIQILNFMPDKIEGFVEFKLIHKLAIS